MSGVIQECNMMFAELIKDECMRRALVVLAYEIDCFLSRNRGKSAEVQVRRLADAYADVYWLLQAQR
jgi:hypothetical protein